VRHRRRPVELDLRIDGRLPEPVEVAAYYVASEALTNAAKHANPSLIRVEADASGRAFRLAVRDDGAGGADPDHGSGLVGLRDRVEAIGGRLEIDSPPGGGTSLRVTIPVGD
jgi:signal transduction histidine kinase